MPSELPRIEVVCFSKPVVKAGTVEIAFRIEGSQLFVFHAARSTWRALHEHLNELFGLPPAAPAPAPSVSRPARTFGKGHRISDAKLALYREAYFFWQASATMSQPAVAQQFGINHSSWIQWLAYHRAALDAERAQVKVPIEKPSGGIL
jgi:hypothetical protein